MTRKVRIYQVYDECDSAGTDSYYCTRKEARAAAKDMINPVINELDVVMNKHGICNALTYCPMR